MNIIGITGKSGSGKSYLANKLSEKLGKSKVITFDNLFSRIMNGKDVVEKIYHIYGDKAVKNGEIDLDTALTNKEIFSTIYDLIIDRVEEAIRQEADANREMRN